MKYSDPRPTCVFDQEVLPNYYSIAFMNVETLESVVIEMYDGVELDRVKIAKIVRNYRLVGANNKHYDNPILALAMKKGTTCAMLKRASDDIIVGGMRSWGRDGFYATHNCDLPQFMDDIDVWEVDPGSPNRQSLKIRGARLHCRTIQEFPFAHDQWLTMEDIEVARTYVTNDLLVTRDMYLELKSQIALRERMSDEYDVDLRSKSDAQMAEAIMRVELERIFGRKLYPDDDIDLSKTFRYDLPKNIKFKTPAMQALAKEIGEIDFTLKKNGDVEKPKALSDKKILLGSMVYTMGLGGLHSTEESVSYFADEDNLLIDRDVVSYYPRIILNNKLFPPKLGHSFLKVFERLFIRRLRAKKIGEADIAETLKIVLNGTFGKTGSIWSILYSPKMLLQITLTGQLSLFMFIEELVLAGFEVISANTDGVVTKVPRHRRADFDAIVFDWELDTGYDTEETVYTSVHSRDVNSYCAIYVDKKSGKKVAKLKGNIGPCGPGLKGASGLKKNPTMQIASDAAVAFLISAKKIEDTIRECTDIRKFVVVRKSTKPVYKDGDPVGKALRWYYSTEERGKVLLAGHPPTSAQAREYNLAKSHSEQDGKDPLPTQATVNRSEGARLCLTLPEFDECPPDLDRDLYIREAYAILQDVGYGAFDPALAGRSGMFLGIQKGQKTLHYVRAESGVAVCDKEMKSIRNPWTEYGSASATQRICKKCREGIGHEVEQTV